MVKNLLHFWEEGNQRFPGKYLLALVVFAFLLRLPLFFYPEVIHYDGAEYIRHAKLILSGDWTGGKAPPFYPALIAFAHVAVPDWELAGILASILFGALLVLPVFYLGKEMFGEGVGILSGVLVAIHPFLNSYSGSVLTESTYYFLVAMIVLMGWYAFERGSIGWILLFSLFTSLAYLTRPEGIGFLIVFSFWVLIVNPSSGKRGWTKKVGIVTLAIFGFLLLSSPYLIQIRKETGRWAITKKFVISIESTSREEGSQLIESFTKRKEISLLSLVKNPLIVLKKIVVGFLKSLYVFQQAYNPILFFFALLVPIFFRGSLRLKEDLYLFAYFLFFLGLVLPFLWVTRRYASQMIPIAIPWAAIGFLEAAAWISNRFRGDVIQKKFPVLLLMVVLVGLFVQGRVIHGRDYRMIQKEVGLWMRDHLPRGQKMMSKMGQESFYAEQGWVKLPEKGYEEIIEEACGKGVRYLVIDENIDKDSPDFLEKAKRGELIRRYELKMNGRWMVVFEMVAPRAE